MGGWWRTQLSNLLGAGPVPQGWGSATRSRSIHLVIMPRGPCKDCGPSEGHSADAQEMGPESGQPCRGKAPVPWAGAVGEGLSGGRLFTTSLGSPLDSKEETADPADMQRRLPSLGSTVLPCMWMPVGGLESSCCPCLAEGGSCCTPESREMSRQDSRSRSGVSSVASAPFLMKL
jgi:hypothetical protein